MSREDRAGVVVDDDEEEDVDRMNERKAHFVSIMMMKNENGYFSEMLLHFPK